MTEQLRPKIPGMFVAVVQIQTTDNETCVGVIDAHTKTVIVVPSATRPRGRFVYDSVEELAPYVAPLARLSVN